MCRSEKKEELKNSLQPASTFFCVRKFFSENRLKYFSWKKTEEIRDPSLFIGGSGEKLEDLINFLGGREAHGYWGELRGDQSLTEFKWEKLKNIECQWGENKNSWQPQGGFRGVYFDTTRIRPLLPPITPVIKKKKKKWVPQAGKTPLQVVRSWFWKGLLSFALRCEENI